MGVAVGYDAGSYEGIDAQRKEYMYKKLIAARPDWANRADLMYDASQVELEFYRGLNDGTIIEAAPAALWSPISGEPTVTNLGYPVSDVRRYGVIPNDVSTDPTEQGNRLIAAVNADAAAGRTTFIPAGYYRCGLNINVSKARLRVEPGAEFGGIIHIGSVGTDNITDVVITGPLVTYDRFGIFKVDGFKFDTALCKSDGTKNVPNPGSRGRGCHIYNNASNISGRLIEVQDMDAASPGADAAISIDGFQTNPSNIDITTLRVRKSDVHGVYLTGWGHKFGLVKVDEWGAGTYVGSGLQDANSLAQSQELKGFWSNRCNQSRIDRLVVNQGTGTRTNAAYDVMVDETTVTTAPITAGSLSFGSIEILNVTGPSRGIAFGDATYPRSYNTNSLSVDVETLRIVVAASRANIAGYGSVNLADGATVSMNTLHAPGTAQTNDILWTASGTQLRLAWLKAPTSRAYIVKASGVVFIDRVTSNKDGHVSGTSPIELAATASASKIGSIEITTSAAHASRGLFLNGAVTDCDFGRISFGQLSTSGGVLCLGGGSNDNRFGKITLVGSANTGTGILFAASALRNTFNGGSVSGFATGVSYASGTVSGVSMGMSISGNTTNTNVPTASFNDLGSTGWQL